MISEDWVNIDEDIPQMIKFNVSINVDVLLMNGEIKENCFLGYVTKRFFDNMGNQINTACIKGWRTSN